MQENLNGNIKIKEMIVIAENVSNRPNEIPISKWLVKNQKYTVLEVVKCKMQGGLLGFKLEEIDLSGCFPYLFFAANRFRLPKEDEVEVEELQFEEMIA